MLITIEMSPSPSEVIQEKNIMAPLPAPLRLPSLNSLGLAKPFYRPESVAKSKIASELLALEARILRGNLDSSMQTV